MAVTPGLLDHLLVFVFAVVLPVHGALIGYPRLRAAVARGLLEARTHTYLVNMALQWILVMMALLSWWLLDRPLSGLGLVQSDAARFWIGLVAVGILLGAQLRRGLRGLRDPDFRRRLRRRTHHLQPILPRSAREVRVFSALSVSAGICEELLYRGVLLQYLAAFGPPLFVYVGSTILFGLAHSYQGARGVVQTALVGALFLALVLLSGSIWLAMIYHAGFNVVSGTLTYRLYRVTDE